MPIRAGYVTKCKKGAPRRWLVLADDGRVSFYVNQTAQLLSDEDSLAAECTLAVAGAACLDKEQTAMPWTAGVDPARRLQLREKSKEKTAAVKVWHNLEAPTPEDAVAWAAAINNYVPPIYKAMAPLKKDTLKVAIPAAAAPAGPAPPMAKFTQVKPTWKPTAPATTTTTTTTTTAPAKSHAAPAVAHTPAAPATIPEPEPELTSFAAASDNDDRDYAAAAMAEGETSAAAAPDTTTFEPFVSSAPLLPSVDSNGDRLDGVSLAVLERLWATAQAAGAATFADVVATVVRPAAAKRFGAYVDLLSTPDTGRPTVFVSISDGDHFGAAILPVLRDYAQEHPDAYFWFDALANSNGGSRGGLTARLAAAAALSARPGAHLCVVDRFDAPPLFADAWAVLTLALAVQRGAELRVRLAPTAQPAARAALLAESDGVTAALARLDLAACDTADPDERDAVHAAVAATGTPWAELTARLQAALRAQCVALAAAADVVVVDVVAPPPQVQQQPEYGEQTYESGEPVGGELYQNSDAAAAARRPQQESGELYENLPAEAAAAAPVVAAAQFVYGEIYGNQSAIDASARE